MPTTIPFSLRGPRLPTANTDAAPGAPGAFVVGFRGREAISTPFRYEVFLGVPEDLLDGFDVRAALGTRATLAVRDDEGGHRWVARGVLSSIELLRVMPGGAALFRVELVPPLWRLSLGQRSRVWTDVKLSALIERLLRECGFEDGDLRRPISLGDDPTMAHACQYRETHLDFLSRKLEDFGVSYYFEHPEAEDAPSRVVFRDAAAPPPRRSQRPVRYLALGDEDTSDTEGLREVTVQVTRVPDGARVRGADYERPDLALQHQWPSTARDPYLLEDLSAARTADAVQGLARAQGEAIAARAEVLRGAGRSYDLRAGYRFELADHPQCRGEHLVTALEVAGFDVAAHRPLAARLGFREEGFRVSFEAIPASVPFRPARVTARPRIYGMELGVVRGPSAPAPSPGQPRYAQLDAQGRYLVALRFDETPGSPPSVRMRMAQPHAGADGAGFHLPLREGTEVLVGFLRGDPELPYIAGVMHDALRPSPVTSANATQNVIETGGGNRVQLEDLAQSESIDLSTPKAATRLRLGARKEVYGEGAAKTDESAGVDLRTDGHIDERAGANLARVVRGKVWEEAGTPSEAPAAKDIPSDAATYTRVVRGDQRVHVYGQTIEKHDGGYTVDTYGQKGIFNFSHYFERTTGDHTEIFGGVRTDLNIGAKNDIALVSKNDFVAGIHIGIELAAYISFELARIEFRGLAFHKAKIQLGRSELKMLKAKVEMLDHDLHLNVAKLMVKNPKLMAIL